MIEPCWRPMTDKPLDIPARPDALWTLVLPYVKGPALLKIEATGTWKYCGQFDCGPDGSRKEGFKTDALNASAPVGALIGKIGGSPADKPDTTGFVFVAGSYAVVVLGDKIEGALYLTMNDQIKHVDHHDGSLQVTISESRSH